MKNFCAFLFLLNLLLLSCTSKDTVDQQPISIVVRSTETTQPTNTITPSITPTLHPTKLIPNTPTPDPNALYLITESGNVPFISSRYAQNRYGISFQYPSSWGIQDIWRASEGLTLSDPISSLKLSFWIDTITTTKRVDTNAHLQAFYDSLKGIRVEVEEPITLMPDPPNGQTASTMVIRQLYSDGSFGYILATAIAHEQRVVVFFNMTGAVNLESIQTVYDHILSSVKINAPPTEPMIIQAGDQWDDVKADIMGATVYQFEGEAQKPVSFTITFGQDLQNSNRLPMLIRIFPIEKTGNITYRDYIYSTKRDDFLVEAEQDTGEGTMTISFIPPNTGRYVITVDNPDFSKGKFTIYMMDD